MQTAAFDRWALNSRALCLGWAAQWLSDSVQCMQRMPVVSEHINRVIRLTFILFISIQCRLFVECDCYLFHFCFFSSLLIYIFCRNESTWSLNASKNVFKIKNCIWILSGRRIKVAFSIASSVDWNAREIKFELEWISNIETKQNEKTIRKRAERNIENRDAFLNNSNFADGLLCHGEIISTWCWPCRLYRTSCGDRFCKFDSSLFPVAMRNQINNQKKWNTTTCTLTH